MIQVSICIASQASGSHGVFAFSLWSQLGCVSFQALPLAALWPWEISLTLCLGFLICEMGIVTESSPVLFWGLFELLKATSVMHLGKCLVHKEDCIITHFPETSRRALFRHCFVCFSQSIFNHMFIILFCNYFLSARHTAWCSGYNGDHNQTCLCFHGILSKMGQTVINQLIIQLNARMQLW